MKEYSKSKYSGNNDIYVVILFKACNNVKLISLEKKLFYENVLTLHITFICCLWHKVYIKKCR